MAVRKPKKRKQGKPKQKLDAAECLAKYAKHNKATVPDCDPLKELSKVKSKTKKLAKKLGKAKARRLMAENRKNVWKPSEDRAAIAEVFGVDPLKTDSEGKSLSPSENVFMEENDYVLKKKKARTKKVESKRHRIVRERKEALRAMIDDDDEEEVQTENEEIQEEKKVIITEKATSKVSLLNTKSKKQRLREKKAKLSIKQKAVKSLQELISTMKINE